MPASDAANSQHPAGLLTADEREAVRLAGQLHALIAGRIVTDEPTRDDDLAGIRAAVRLIQLTVLAWAAAREYPREFRLPDTVIPGPEQETQQCAD